MHVIKKVLICLHVIILSWIFSFTSFAQRPTGGRNPLQSIPGSNVFSGGGSLSGSFKDSLLHRTGLEDSITLRFRTIHDSEWYAPDTSISDFYSRWPVAWTSNSLGNFGSAVRSLRFQPIMQAGWDHGFHAFDAFINQPEQTLLYASTRPFTELNYILGSKTEQIIRVLHTQAIRPDWQFSFRYQLLNVPGVFKNQKNSHNGFLLTNRYLSRNRRYAIDGILSADKVGASENGGLKDLGLLDSLPSFADRFNLPVNFGGSQFQQQTFLSSFISTGNQYRVTQYYIRQHYDFGKRDSVQIDSSSSAPSIPRFRIEHIVRHERYSFLFQDLNPDGLSYNNFYKWTNVPDTVRFQDQWQVWRNGVHLYQYPDKKNPRQYLRAGITYEYFQLDTGYRQQNFSNWILSGAYHLKTKNQKWDVELEGQLHTAGAYFGNYQLMSSLKRVLSKSGAFIHLQFEQVNRTPSYIFNSGSSFHRLIEGAGNFKKENLTRISATYQEIKRRFYISFQSVGIANYTYFRNYIISDQWTGLLNVFQLEAGKQIRIRKNWNCYTELILQQKTGDAPVNIPLLLMRNRFAYEGLFFKNLQLSTGLEIRYHTSFKMDGYSPLTGQFFFQKDTRIQNRPDVNFYMNTRIRRLDLSIRVENLNTFSLSDGGFFRNNFTSPLQPAPGLYARLGIFWRFVN